MRRFAVALVTLAASCTGATTPTAQPAPSVTTSPTPTASGEPTPTGSPQPGAPMVLGAPLPDGCDQGDAKASQTVAFVAGGRAWALNAGSGRLTCLFRSKDPGPFAWGPQGDRVLLSDMQIRFVDGAHLAIGAAPPEVFDWGRPIGKAVVFREPSEEDTTDKYVLLDDATHTLDATPVGTYRAIAYHPSGEALAMSVTRKDGLPQIFISTNEGERPQRMIFGASATDFPSLEFTSDGRYLLYLAQHKGGFAQLHMIDLQAPEGIIDLWKSPSGVTASGLVLPPGIGDTLAFTEGDSCETSVAVFGSVDDVTPALPEEDRPTRALGYLDNQRLLVAAGGCGEPQDLYVVSQGSLDLVVTGASTAAARADGPDEAAPLPEDLLGNVQEFG